MVIVKLKISVNISIVGICLVNGNVLIMGNIMVSVVRC